MEATASEVTLDNVIAALAAETGWNLDLAKPVSVDEDGIATVAFAADSGVYGQPPEEQKDVYHVYDVEDWIYTVFNSVAESSRPTGQPMSASPRRMAANSSLTMAMYISI